MRKVTILHWRNKSCLCCPCFYTKEKIKKSCLAFFCSCWFLPLCLHTFKSWSFLSDPFTQVGSSWTLRKLTRLFPSGVGSGKESESLLLMPSVSHSFMSQYHTGQNNSPWKYNLFEVKKRIYRVSISWKYPETRTRKKEGATEWNSVFSGSPSETKAENWTKNRAGLTDLHFTNFTKEHKSIIISPLRSTWCWISLALF